MESDTNRDSYLRGIEPMTRINYRSDFDFRLDIKNREDLGGANQTIGFYDFDWVATITSGSTSGIRYVARRVGEESKNCYAEEDGGIHIVCDNHRLSPGKLWCDFEAQLPDSRYADGIRNLHYKFPLGIELVRDTGDTNGGRTEVSIPFVYITAYDLAVRDGYDGSAEEYMELMKSLPDAVKRAEELVAESTTSMTAEEGRLLAERVFNENNHNEIN